MNTCLIYDETGQAVSIGTVLADPMPEQLTVVQLAEADANLLAAGRGIWDAATLSVVTKPEHLWPPMPDDDLDDLLQYNVI
jgi:hypothetical protein